MLHKSLEFVAKLQAVPATAEQIQQSLRRLAAESVRDLELLQQAGADVGLRLTFVRRRFQEVLPDLHPSHPWLVARKLPGETVEAAVFLEYRKGQVHCYFPTRDRRPHWRKLDEVLGLLEIDDAGANLDWLVAEPAAPLAAMRSPEAGPAMEPWPRLKAMLEGERQTLWVAVIYSIVIGLLTLVVPVTVQALVNTVAFGSVIQPLVVLTLFVFLALGFSTALNGLRAWVVEILQRSIFSRVATDVTWRVLRVRADAFDRYHGPELVNRFFDVVTVQKSAALLLIDGLSIFMQTLIGMVLVALYHPVLLAFDMFLIAAMLFIIFGLGRGAVVTSIKESKAKYAFEAWLEQIATHLVTFKSAGGLEYATSRSESLLEEWLFYRKQHFSILIRQIVGSFTLQALASAILLGIGGWLVIERQLTLGQLVASELIVTVMVSGFTKFGKQLEVFYDLQAAMDKLGELVDLPLERAGGEAVIPANGPAGIRLTDIRSGYGENSILDIKEFTIRPGERIGLIGHHGSGKSTLADLLFGLRNPAAGSLRLDGVEYKSIPLTSIRQHVALVRDMEVFAGSVLDNVRLGRNDITLADAVAALRQVGLEDDVNSLPEGINTPLQPTGRPLSQGQACRLMLARAIAGKPRLLILDDVLGIIFHPSAPWTLVCISERPDLLARCSRIAVLENGDLQESTLTEVPV
jgi:putative ABC transport system ATP-binding protein